MYICIFEWLLNVFMSFWEVVRLRNCCLNYNRLDWGRNGADNPQEYIYNNYKRGRKSCSRVTFSILLLILYKFLVGFRGYNVVVPLGAVFSIFHSHLNTKMDITCINHLVCQHVFTILKKLMNFCEFPVFRTFFSFWCAKLIHPVKQFFGEKTCNFVFIQ